MTRLLGRRVLSSKSDFTADPPCMGPVEVGHLCLRCRGKICFPILLILKLKKKCKKKKFSSHHSLTNYKTRNQCLILKALQWVAEADESLARNEILTDDEIIRTVTAEDDDDDDVNPVNPAKFSHSEAVTTLNTTLQWTEEKKFEAHEIMLLSRLRDRAFELKIGTAAQENTDFFGH
ncbi:hypothetical protein AVEN_221219-1 [Araneus ventricosus]|uniref:DDE-1 domain-containing protein n=1 Tax=Araneus ventricosus TaxID=182803 RepID=A0A4Y2WVG5_ARAVE|nr:hypothetical protein AVEN_221219-1 [Araneus ventricosus]